MRVLAALMRDRRGAAAAEMALMTPLLLILMMGGAEIGYYFWQQHVVTKAVRDGARYAGRLPFGAYTCSGFTNGNAGPEATEVANVTATGHVGSGAITRLPGFTASTVTFTVSCSTTTTTGIYTSQAGGAPQIRVRAAVPYTALFATWFIQPGAATATCQSGLCVEASAQSAVMGV